MEHPITPPPELVQQWLCSNDYSWGPLEQTSITITANRLQNIATAAAQWGADQELEACIELLRENGWHTAVRDLRSARRPKPPSLKEQALEQLGSIQIDLNKFGMGIGTDIIRRALKALPND
jgi:hypothetical protein